jgi:hypothetical protein
MYAVVQTVSIGATAFETAQKTLLGEVVPRVGKAPGFVKGYWAVRDDHRQGLSMIVFESKAQAEAAANMARGAGMPPGVTLETIEVREILAQA